MNAARAVIREGWRLAWSSKARAAIVVGVVAAAVATGGRPDTSLAVLLLVPAVCFVARRSAAPARAASAAAWRRAGAPPGAIHASAWIETFVLGASGLVIGLVITVIVGDTTRLATTEDLSIALILVALIALLPTAPTQSVRRREPTRLRRAARGVGAATRIALVVVGLMMMVGTATTVRSDFDLSLSGVVIEFWLVVLGTIFVGAVVRRVLPLVEWSTRLRSVAALAQRRGIGAPVRFVVVVALTLAASTSVLGASVEARPDVRGKLQAAVDRLPESPPNVALVRIDLTQQAIQVALRGNPTARSINAEAAVALRSDLEPAALDAIASAVPRAHVVPLRHVVLTTGPMGSPAGIEAICLLFCNPDVVVENPRLASVYRSPARYADTTVTVTAPSGRSSTVVGWTRVPTASALERAVDRGVAPVATFADLIYEEVAASDVARAQAATAIRSAFVVTPDPLTRTDIARLRAVARTLPHAPLTQVSLKVPSFAPAAPVATPERARSSLRNGVPWAATTNAQRWHDALTAALIALVAVLAALGIETIDRRRDVERLERLGATRAQVRGAAALQAGMLVGAVTWIELLMSTMVVFVGTRAFNHAEPIIPVPLSMPWTIVAFLAFGLPALAAGCAALLARAQAPSVSASVSAAGMSVSSSVE